MKCKHLILALLLVLTASLAHAIGGYIYARTIIKSENGNPYWAAYDDKGQLAYGPTEATGTLAVDQVVLVSAESYKNDLRIWDKLLDDIEAYNDALPEGATLRGNPKVVHRDQLKDKQFHLLGTGEPPAPGQSPPPGESFTIPDNLLLADAAFVVLKAPSLEEGEVWQYPTKDATQLILAQMPFDPSNTSLLAMTADDTEFKSLLLSRETGEYLERSRDALGFYSAFLNDMTVTDSTSYEFWHRNASKWNPLEDKVPGPVSGALMSTSDRFVRPVADVSDAEGKYLLMAGLGPPCNIMTSMQNYVTAMLYTSSFNPRRSTGVLPYYLQKTWYMPCSGWMHFGLDTTLLGQLASVNTDAINATLALPLMQLDFAVDMIGVAGKARVENSVKAFRVDNGRISSTEGVKLQGWTDEAMKKVEIVGGGEETAYRLTDELKTILEKRDNEDEKRTRELQPKFDLDGDGTDDTVKRGRVVCIQRKGSAANTETGEDPKEIMAGPVVPGTDNRCQAGYEKGFQTLELDEIADKDLQQGIYFAGADTIESNCAIGTNTCAYPSVVKLLDDLMVNADQGLLKSLNLEDLRNTDVYVFRESTGELIAERTGLKKDEYQENCEDAVTPTGACDNFKDGNPRFFYRMEMRGMHESAFRPGMQYAKLDETFKRWQVNSGMNPALYEREANHLKPGESIKVIAINRATGYLGSVRTVVNNYDASVAPPLPEIIMGPPNLKVWAKHTYKVKEGATKDEIRNYLIGNEGAAKADDMTVEVYTEWLDQDGSPLPAGLKDFGYTGRIARISGKNVLQAATGSSEAIDSLAHFPIKPGRNLQVVKVEGGGSQHLYVQVNGEPMTRLVDFGTPEGAIELNKRVGDHKPDFKTLGAGEQLLQYRPKHYVPILTPIFNENDTLASKQLAQQNSEVTASSVDGIYQWRYRPEYQVSVYDLMVKEIKAQRIDPATGMVDPDYENDLFKTHQIFSGDDLVKFVLEFKDFVASPLDMFSTKTKELILSLGEEEIRIDLSKPRGQNGYVIDNLEQITNLNIEDFLMIRLYQNNDTANVLWEFADPPAVRVYYALPDINNEQEAKDDRAYAQEVGLEAVENIQFIRTLGGVRLRLEYTPSLWDLKNNITSVKWENLEGYCYQDNRNDKVNKSGYRHDAESVDCADMIKTRNELGDVVYVLYWEPADWSPEDTIPQASLTVTSTHQDPNGNESESSSTQYVEFVRRALAPVDPPMEGSDVAMLEQMLWQLGLSPQKPKNHDNPNAGVLGARINASRNNTSKNWTQACDGVVTDRRDRFYHEWKNCPAAMVSLEGMVRRFQGRSWSGCDDGREGKKCINDYQGISSLSGITGEVDDQTMQKLQLVWHDYQVAHDLYSQEREINQNSTGINQWIAGALDVWENGSTNASKPTYTESVHQDVLDLSGLSGSPLSRSDLVKKWKLQETSKYGHWGGNGFPKSPYRISEGAADEFGSIGFSQIKYAYRYGALKCDAISSLNLYNPADNIRGFGAFTAAEDIQENKDCGTKSFYKALSSNGDWRDIKQDLDGPVSYVHGPTEGWIFSESTDDSYELLMKGIAGFNGGVGLSATWANSLKANHTVKMGKGYSNRTYAINIMRSYGISARTYVWKGGQDATGNDWCFAYGEEQWIQGINWTDLKADVASGIEPTVACP